jgi:tetratricopeptide (TPR) repeat protein
VETDDYQAAYNEFKQVVRRTELDEREFTGQQTGVDRRIDIQNAIDYVVANIYAIREKDAARVKKGFCQLLIGRQYQAIETIQKVPFHQRSALCLYLMGLAYEHQDWHPQAWDSYAAAVKIDPDIGDAHKKIGIYCSNTGKWLEAERAFSEALRLNPRNTVIYNLRGVVRFNMADYHNAITDFSMVLSADTTNFSTIYNRMETYAILKDSAGVSRDRAKLLAIRESIYQQLQAMVDDLTEAQDVNAALAYLYRYRLENPYVAAPQILMLRMLRKHDNWKQIDYLRLTDEPTSKIFYFEEEHAYILVCKGLSYMHINNKRTAEELFTQAINVDPNCSEAYLERGRMYVMGDNPQAEKRASAITDLRKSASLGNDEAKAVLEIVDRAGTRY